MNILELGEYFHTKPFVNDTPIFSSLLRALPVVGASPLLGALSLIWPNYSELYISELNEYFDTKPFVNDPSCLLLPAGGSVLGWGFTPA